MAVRLAKHCLAGVPSTAQATIMAVLAERMASIRELLVKLVHSCLATAGAAALPCVSAEHSVSLKAYPCAMVPLHVAIPSGSLFTWAGCFVAMNHCL